MADSLSEDYTILLALGSKLHCNAVAEAGGGVTWSV